MSEKPQRQRPGGTSPLSRPSLTANVEALKVGDQPADPGTTEPAKPRTREPVNTGSTDSQEPGTTESRTEPRYTQYVRKEARVRDDQATALLVLRKKVAAQRTTKVEPVTDNVLIRLAIDLLFAHSDRLRGDTEEELRASLLETENH
ncbi:hypothetical protein AB0454_35650 [Streptomyces sp. NPDC093509]|uniref:hypothetical protein n=1 Tax=Streptomyces sp. NPDC093509 TaxID=3154982 RepID=UPI00344D1F0C